MDFSLINGFDHRRIDIHSHHLITMMGRYSCRRQTDVAQSYKYNLLHRISLFINTGKSTNNLCDFAPFLIENHYFCAK